MKWIYNCVLICFFLYACDNNSKSNIDVSNIKINAKYSPFHKEYFNCKAEDFGDLKQKYPYLFPKNIPDSIWVSKISNSEEQLLFQMADSVYGDFTSEKNRIISLFKHIKYYKPSFQEPEIITLITNLDYENSVLYKSKFLFISLDMYLGRDSEVYQSFPPYISNNYTKDHLLVDIAKKIVQKEFEYLNGRSFLESMIYKGKELFLLQSILPKVSEQELMGYAAEKYNWALENESEIWSYFISKELIYSTDQKLNNRFINPAPFSKFYLESDSDSPGGIGAWIGFRIVQAYMSKNKINLEKLLITDAETIFLKSKYKPKK